MVPSSGWPAEYRYTFSDGKTCIVKYPDGSGVYLDAEKDGELRVRLFVCGVPRPKKAFMARTMAVENLKEVLDNAQESLLSSQRLFL